MDDIERGCLARELEVAILRMAIREGDARMDWTLYQGDDSARLYRVVARRHRAMVRLLRALAKLAGA